MGLRRLLKVNFDRASALNTIRMWASIRGATPDEHFNDVRVDMATLDRAHQQCEKQAAASKGAEFAKLRVHGTKACPDVLSNTGLLKGLPARIVKGSGDNTNLDLTCTTRSRT